MNPYSTSFAALQGLSGDHALTVPSGEVWVIRDIDVYADDFAPAEFYFIGASTQTIAYWQSSGASTPSTYQWRGRQVFEPGETIILRATNAADVTMSGYRLTLT